MILITSSLHSQISYPFLDGFDRERQKSKLQITKLIIIVVLIVIIIIIIMITIIIISYHYQFLNQLKQMTFCCCRSFLSVCLLIYSLSKLEGLKQILPARCQRLVLVPWTTEVPCDKKAARTLYPPDWIPHLSSFPEKKQNKTKQIHITTWLYICFAILEGKHSPSPSS